VPKLPSITAKVLLSALAKAGFVEVRQKGSHLRLQHPDGRVVTVPVHQGQDIGRGLLAKILRDAELSRDDFLELL
jgi:predicted RNA binding protein YcfA (HicA-like mRNA interferase family)